MILNTSDRSIECVLAAVVTTSQLPFVVNYTNIHRDQQVQNNSNNSTTNNTSTVTIVSAPQAGARRVIRYISVVNSDTVSATITIRLNDNGTLRNIIRLTLDTGDHLIYTEAAGWFVLDSTGQIKSGDPFPATTTMIFQQTTAPTGWTKLTTNNDRALRMVSGTAGTGGATAFTTVFGTARTTGSYTLVTADIPSHTHTLTDPGHGHSGSTTNAVQGENTGGPSQMSTGGPVDDFAAASVTIASATSGITIGNTGGGGAHSHTLSLDLQYVDVIAATKN